MKYITSVTFPNDEELMRYMDARTYQDWPFNVFLHRGLENIPLSDITIFYGNNGSGKSTILNCICEKLKAKRCKPIFKDKVWSDQLLSYYFPFDDYLEKIIITLNDDPETGLEMNLPDNVRLITSDDIFSRINNTIRSNNFAVKEDVFARKEYRETKKMHLQLRDFSDFDEFDRRVKIRRKTMGQYVRENSRRKLKLFSNGETALDYFEEMLEPDGIYFLDEPENCLSPIFQMQLAKLILDSKRFFNCQFIIATHSPLILNLPDALIYDLDSTPIYTKPWYELENVKVYFDFFDKYRDKFTK